jgi:glucosamine 6-phosphate synthetase-like amidotransferase/phosphosugar isomerase protein
MEYYSNRIPNLTNKVSWKSDFYYIARGVNFAMANEGALKLKEIEQRNRYVFRKSNYTPFG